LETLLTEPISRSFEKAVAKYGYFYNLEQQNDTLFKHLVCVNTEKQHAPLSGRGPCKINKFFQNTLSALGGSETRAIDMYKKFGRFGGGRMDTLVYMKNYDKEPLCNWKPRMLPQTMCEKIFGADKIALGDIFFSIVEPDVPSDTSPGITYKRLGFTKKADALPLAQEFLLDLLNKVRSKEGCDTPTLLWCVGGRPKFTEVKSAYVKVSSRKSVGRSVWMSDMEEAIVSRHFSKHMNKKYMGNPLQHKVMVNIDKIRDAPLLHEWVKQHEYFIEADYTKFDSSIPADVVLYAFDVLENLFSKMDDVNQYFFSLIRTNFLHSYVDLSDGRLLKKFLGVPSGSGLTSIMNSICNYIMLDEILVNHCKLPEENWNALVYGDDSLIGLNIPPGPLPSAFKVRRSLVKYMPLVFSATLKNEDTKLSRDKYVRVVEPVYSGDTSKGTSLLKPDRLIYHDKEPECGTYRLITSHRWWYDFTKTWKFLSYSMTPEGRMIRPTSEVLARVFHPETPVKTWDDHVTVLKMALLENFDNAHTRNRIYHYLLDAWWVMSAKCPQKELPQVESSVLRGRSFYRHSSFFVNLRSHPELVDFNKFWDDLEYNMRSLHNRPTLDESYYQNVKRGKLTQMMLDSESNPAYFDRVLEISSRLGLQPPIKIRAYHFGKKIKKKYNLFTQVKHFLYNRLFYYNEWEYNIYKKKIKNISKNIKKEYLSVFTTPRETFKNHDLLAVCHGFTLKNLPSFL